MIPGKLVLFGLGFGGLLGLLGLVVYSVVMLV
jgi:hypothetical protein